MSREEILRLIKDIIFEVAKKYGVEIDRVILFGSRARGDFREDSDWDILVITKNKLDKTTKLSFISKVIESLLDYDIDSEIIVVSSKYYNRFKHVYGDISGIATFEGVML